MSFWHSDVINHYVGLIGYCRSQCENCIFQPVPGNPCPVKLLEENYQLGSLFRRARILDDQAVENERRIFK